MKGAKKKADKGTASEQHAMIAPSSSEPVALPEMNSNIKDNNLKKWFFISLAAMLLIIWISGYNVGFHQDEMDMNNYGKANIAYYLSGGKDTSYRIAVAANVITISGVRQDTLLRYYGSAFDYLAVGFNQITDLDKGKNEYNSRHIFNQFFAVLCILFAGLSACKISGWRAAIFTQWLLFLTPTFFGLALFDTKDIPFCTGYAASIYFIIIFLEELPSPSWKNILLMVLSIAFTIGVRIGGLLLLFYLFLFPVIYILFEKELKEKVLSNIKNVAFKIALILAGSLIIAILTWPFLLSNPFKSIPAAMGLVNRFPVNIPFMFEGETVNAHDLPYYYLVKILLVTVPTLMYPSGGKSLAFRRRL